MKRKEKMTKAVTFMFIITEPQKKEICKKNK